MDVKSVNNIVELKIISDLNFFDEVNDLYQYIIELNDPKLSLENEYETDENLVKGCQSDVWIKAFKVNDKPIFKYKSDAPIPNGLAAMFCCIYGDLKQVEILNYQTSIFEETEILNYFSPTRRIGVYGIIDKIKEQSKLI